MLGHRVSNRGHARERQVRKVLESEGWWVCRAAGSLGDADLVAAKEGEQLRLIEVKATKRGPYHGFGPDRRADMSVAARRAGALAWLYWWPPHGQMKMIREDYWPL